MSAQRRWSNVTRSGKLHYNQEQLAVAKAASALEYARSRGYNLGGGGNRWTLAEHDSMVFLADGRWYWNSRGYSGRAIEFIMYYEEKTLPEAVLILNGVDLGAPTSSMPHPDYTPQQQDVVPKTLEIPTRSPDMRRTFSYLAVTRGIDYQIIRELVKQGRIFESVREQPDGKIYHNAAFAGLDEHGVIRSISLRGCAASSTYKGEVPGSNKEIPFLIPGTPGAEWLYVFESAIDAMSHATLQMLVGAPWDRCFRVAMSGNNTIALIQRILKEHPGVHKIAFCLDNDDAGQKQCASYLAALQEAGVPEDCLDARSVPCGKDWNEYLQCWRAVVRRHSELPITETDGPEGPTYGRIHYLEDDGAVGATVAYSDSRRFAAAVQKLRELRVPFVAETPAQLLELQRNQERCKERQDGRSRCT